MKAWMLIIVCVLSIIAANGQTKIEQRAPMMLTAPYYGPIYPAISKYELH